MNPLNAFVQLRVAVAFLGEKHAAGWWESEFLCETGIRYLAFAFPRTPILSAVQGATEAARRVHDERIGKRGAIHLFRLPYEAELMVFERLRENEKMAVAPVATVPEGRDDALARLHDLAPAIENGQEGAVFIGTGNPISDMTVVRRMAALYLGAFESNRRVFPFFESPP
jgi:hypothetical protein